MADVYVANEKRYEKMRYNRVGKSGLKFPAVSLGFWHNFGTKDNYDTMKAMCRTAFDEGITQFDLANNYGPVYGAAETNAGRILKEDFRPYRDELIITTKAGYDMWPGPYGNWGSKKYLTASVDQSLQRLQLEYVDIFYHHRMDPETPLEETMGALNDIVKSGKALYVGLSNYNGETLEKACAILDDLKCPFIINQNKTLEDSAFLILLGICPVLFQALPGLLTGAQVHGTWGYPMVYMIGILLFYFFPINIDTKIAATNIIKKYAQTLIV